MSSMMDSTLSRSITFNSSRSVLSKLPTSEPVDEICSANSTHSRSTSVALMVPRLAMVWDSSLISSSSMKVNRRAACSSPSDSIKTAAFSGPVRLR